ncbi:indolepyruvate ferredoxin oxidoreductase subunit alpha [Methanobacterium petrolearium]|uniref:indolepyruvate ferredoxin oxidoreductase subunit alpha n=1 Tax=Methanobacterium petrolearium TaxID=710190 RepID=UPI001AE5A9E0|nr:indolepyruvate ferredoxin oxidoreductase subunit alpha [Methanobacterium petrolearium]MBP1945668.1 indolepyruvate ferredoxin oxidoreductase alpha subunit [Methanobacterium petrolearium]BDZ71908.1 indolepyruvate oxidoreductase [Methanobacterium petrolearium]
MNIKEILTRNNKDKLFLMGNEAAVRGALEAGVAVASTYPGTPSSEIGDVLSVLAKDAGMYFEFSVNEKVALEVSAAAAASGLRSFTFMKHVGVNVAADSLVSLAYTSVRGGMVILTADDPSIFSSQNEQDNRHYARLANIPLLEAANPQEVKELMKYAYQLSEEFEIPVILRTTTRVSHMRSVVELGPLAKVKGKGYFDKDPQRFVPVPAAARIMHKNLVEKMDKITVLSNNSSVNQVYDQGGHIGIITSGSAFNYAMDVVEENELPVNILKLTFTYPFPEKKVLEFLEKVERVLVVEEVDPIMEKEVLAIMGKYGLEKRVHGKLDGTLPMIYEFNPDIVLEGFGRMMGVELSHKGTFNTSIGLPNRPPTLCPGCPHRAAYFEVKQTAANLGIDDVIFPTDIGCYTLGIESPYQVADYLLSMGSSIGTSCGFSKATDQTVVSFIGDSTFFHAGIPPLINAVHNKNHFVLVILDNRTTAMTGGQPHPGLPVDGMGMEAPEISIPNIVKACGVEFVETINPLSVKKSQETFEKALQFEGVAVVISQYPCMLIKNRTQRGKNVTIQVQDDKCTNCNTCVMELTCPAIYTRDDGKIRIDPLMCRKCSVCVQTCPEKAIKAKRIDTIGTEE